MKIGKESIFLILCIVLILNAVRLRTKYMMHYMKKKSNIWSFLGVLVVAILEGVCWCYIFAQIGWFNFYGKK